MANLAGVAIHDIVICSLSKLGQLNNVTKHGRHSQHREIANHSSKSTRPMSRLAAEQSHVRAGRAIDRTPLPQAALSGFDSLKRNLVRLRIATVCIQYATHARVLLNSRAAKVSEPRNREMNLARICSGMNRRRLVGWGNDDRSRRSLAAAMMVGLPCL